VTVRETTEEDAPAVAAVAARSYRFAFEGAVPEAALERAARPPADDPDATTLVAERDGAVVGYAVVRRSRDPGADAETGELHALYVDPDEIGTGVGRALDAAARERLRRDGFRQATLWVLATNERARRFYRAAGWRPDGVTRIIVVDGRELPHERWAIGLDT
jgi:GNAT superfamily N-acetyltransferase